jgi:CheY-like chemotaxis protein
MSKRISVLIVDESQTFSMYLALLLQSMGFKSLRVSQPESAKFVLTRGFTDFLIIGDLSGPESTHQVVKELAASCSGSPLPIIVISRHDDPTERQACYEAGSQAYLLKPLQPKALHDALNAHMTPFSERRLNLRSKVEISSDVSVDGQASRPLLMLSLSRGGALIAYDRHLPTGTPVSLSLPLKNETLFLDGSVTYNLSNVNTRTPRAFCVLFHQVPPLHGEKIDRHLEAILDECRLVPDSIKTLEDNNRVAAN